MENTEAEGQRKREALLDKLSKVISSSLTIDQVETSRRFGFIAIEKSQFNGMRVSMREIVNCLANQRIEELDNRGRGVA